MKQLLSGTAVALALVIAAPVWAQTTTPSSDTKVRHHVTHHSGHHATHRMSRRGAPNENNANQLNAQQLTGSGAPSASPGGMGSYPSPYGQPNPEQGIPGAGAQAPASTHYPSGPGPAYMPGQTQSSPTTH